MKKNHKFKKGDFIIRKWNKEWDSDIDFAKFEKSFGDYFSYTMLFRFSKKSVRDLTSDGESETLNFSDDRDEFHFRLASESEIKKYCSLIEKFNHQHPVDSRRELVFAFAQYLGVDCGIVVDDVANKIDAFFSKQASKSKEEEVPFDIGLLRDCWSSACASGFKNFPSLSKMQEDFDDWLGEKKTKSELTREEILTELNSIELGVDFAEITHSLACAHADLTDLIQRLQAEIEIDKKHSW